MMKKQIIHFLLLFFCFPFFAQHQVIQPYEELGIEVEVLTLSDGKYQEMIPNDTLVRMGSVLFNHITGEVVSVVVEDTIYAEYGLKADVASRFLSRDPLARDFPWNSPYAFAENRVIDGLDLEGLEYVDYGLKVAIDRQKKEVEVSGQVIFKIKILNLSSHQMNSSMKIFHERKGSKTFDLSIFSANNINMTFDPNTGETIGAGGFKVIARDFDVNIEYSTINKFDEIQKGDIVMLLADDVEGDKAAGVADNVGNVYAVEINLFNKENHTPTHEEGHIIGGMLDVKGKNAPKGYLMSYGDDGKGYRLSNKEKGKLLENLLYRSGYDKKHGKKSIDTRKRTRDFIKEYNIKGKI